MELKGSKTEQNLMTAAPEVCPVCSHPKAYFEIKAENY